MANCCNTRLRQAQLLILLKFCLCFSYGPFLYQQTMGYDCPSLCPPGVCSAPKLGGGTAEKWGAVKKNFPALCTGICAPTFNLLPASLCTGNKFNWQIVFSFLRVVCRESSSSEIEISISNEIKMSPICACHSVA